jgi:ABC-type Na+ efflux pump permease subunit
MPETTADPAGRVRWAVRLHQVGAGCLAAIGVGHLLAVHLLVGPLPAGEQQVADLSARVTSPLLPGGLARTVLQLNTGYSIGVAMGLLAFGLVVIAAVRAAPTLAERPTLFGVLCLLTAAAFLVLAAVAFPEPPIVAAALSTACHAAALALVARGRLGTGG